MKSLPRTPVVYLAGGTRSEWQDKVKAALPGVMFIDPREHRCRDDAVYTAWDLTGVQLCDIVFGFIEKDKPQRGRSGARIRSGRGAGQTHRVRPGGRLPVVALLRHGPVGLGHGA